MEKQIEMRVLYAKNTNLDQSQRPAKRDLSFSVASTAPTSEGKQDQRI